MSIGVTGSTGHLGRLVVGQLKRRGHGDDVVGFARSPEKASDLDIAVRRMDYDQPETLNSALPGVETLLLISADEMGERKRQHGNVIDAAKNAGVGRIVYTSLLRADTSSLSLAGEHAATEAMLKASGIPHTILRNGWYTENYAGAVKGALARGVLVGSAGEGKISSAARADFAEAAAVVLTTDGHVGKTYELAGDEAYTLGDLAAEISRQASREIPYRNLPVGEYAAVLTQAGIPEQMARVLAGWDEAIARGALFHDGRELSGLIGRPTTPMSASVREFLESATGE